ncbi:MAG: putative oxidoreductase [Firmicutes bacterium ADurb.Bin182]|nr:MAG: putative oxidoreductase [Firmicutes bacterium ADurb.Bin182]
MVISKGNLEKGCLRDRVVLITGAGGGIGFEAVRCLLWLGASVIIAEIDNAKVKQAQSKLEKEFGSEKILVVRCDISEESGVIKLIRKAKEKFGSIDTVINNATIAPIGPVHEVGIKQWDRSYQVNLRGPVLLISHLLPDMLRCKSGVIVLVPSSGAAPYMGAYEVFKTSQVELCNTLCAELEETGVIAFSIGPGIVKTETADNAIRKLAPLYNKSVEEFYGMNEAVLISAEEAGAGFAAAVANAESYVGMEISSLQALQDAGITIQTGSETASVKLDPKRAAAMQNAIKDILGTFTEQSEGWKQRNTFERQWIVRDFKKYTGSAAETVTEQIKGFTQEVLRGSVRHAWTDLPFEALKKYYEHQMDLLRGYEKDPEKLQKNIELMKRWVNSIELLKGLFFES